MFISVLSHLQHFARWTTGRQFLHQLSSEVLFWKHDPIWSNSGKKTGSENICVCKIGVRSLKASIDWVVFGRPYYWSCLWHDVSSVCRLSVMFCIVAKRYVLAKKCLKEWIGNQGQKVHFLGRRHISTSGFAAMATKTLTNTTIWFVAALSLIVDVRTYVRTDVRTYVGRTFLPGLLGHLPGDDLK